MKFDFMKFYFYARSETSSRSIAYGWKPLDIGERSGQMTPNRYCLTRTLDVYEAISRSGAHLTTADMERMAMLRPKLELANG